MILGFTGEEFWDMPMLLKMGRENAVVDEVNGVAQPQMLGRMLKCSSSPALYEYGQNTAESLLDDS